MKLQAMMVVILLSGFPVQGQNSEAELFQNAQLYASGKLLDAEKSFAEITRDHPANVAAQMYLGQTLFREEKFAEAIAPYEKVRELR
jgi:cytochrome c-type biogenesis protein CcmH/NrfG